MGALEIAWDVAEPPLLSDAEVERAVAEALAEGGRPTLRLGVVFVDEPTLTRLHAERLGDPAPTDVITFDLGDPDDPDEGQELQGEVYVSVDRAREVAGRRGVPPERELTLYVVHGALHLVGFDDHEPADRARMRSAEEAVLARLGFAPDDHPHAFGAD